MTFKELGKKRGFFYDYERTLLNLDNENLDDLNGIENFTNLKYLNFQHNNIKDISELKRLYKLERLNATDNLIDDISPLKNLTKLEVLILDNNPVNKLFDSKYPTIKQKLNIKNYTDKTFEKFVFDHENC